jgi:hypothetical protein
MAFGLLSQHQYDIIIGQGNHFEVSHKLVVLYNPLSLSDLRCTCNDLSIGHPNFDGVRHLC